MRADKCQRCDKADGILCVGNLGDVELGLRERVCAAGWTRPSPSGTVQQLVQLKCNTWFDWLFFLVCQTCDGAHPCLIKVKVQVLKHHGFLLCCISYCTLNVKFMAGWHGHSPGACQSCSSGAELPLHCGLGGRGLVHRSYRGGQGSRHKPWSLNVGEEGSFQALFLKSKDHFKYLRLGQEGCYILKSTKQRIGDLYDSITDSSRK